MRLFKNQTVKEKSFKWIKNNLDPDKSYIVFENKVKNENDSIFFKEISVFQYLERNGILWEKIFDTDLHKEYLVIQIDPGNEEELMGELIEYKFTKDTVYYLYKSQQ